MVVTSGLLFFYPLLPDLTETEHELDLDGGQFWMCSSQQGWEGEPCYRGWRYGCKGACWRTKWKTSDHWLVEEKAAILRFFISILLHILLAFDMEISLLIP